MATLAIIFWIISGIFFIMFGVSILDKNSNIAFMSLCFIISVFAFVIGIILWECSKEPKKPKIKEYPLTEWRMDYKITTMNEKSDTTLVLTKIK